MINLSVFVSCCGPVVVFAVMYFCFGGVRREADNLVEAVVDDVFIQQKGEYGKSLSGTSSGDGSNQQWWKSRLEKLNNPKSTNSPCQRQ